MTKQTKQLMTARETAEYIQTSVKTVYRLRSEGKLPGYKIGHSIRFKKEDIDKATKQEATAL